MQSDRTFFIDSQEWQNHYIGFKPLFEHERIKTEIKIKIVLKQSSSGLFHYF